MMPYEIVEHLKRAREAIAVVEQAMREEHERQMAVFRTTDLTHEEQQAAQLLTKVTHAMLTTDNALYLAGSLMVGVPPYEAPAPPSDNGRAPRPKRRSKSPR